MLAPGWLNPLTGDGTSMDAPEHLRVLRHTKILHNLRLLFHYMYHVSAISIFTPGCMPLVPLRTAKLAECQHLKM